MIHLETNDNGTWNSRYIFPGNDCFRDVFEVMLKALIKQGAKLECFRFTRKL